MRSSLARSQKPHNVVLSRGDCGTVLGMGKSDGAKESVVRPSVGSLSDIMGPERARVYLANEAERKSINRALALSLALSRDPRRSPLIGRRCRV
jgi:hypothetical protein